MSAPTPHYLLFSASARADADGPLGGDWRFVLESVDGSTKVEIADSEPDIRGERLELLAVVRGLEALEQPSRVTLVTPSRYVSRGLSDGLTDWRENDWQWERHGEMVPVKNRDLWQRVDRALEFHRVECRQWRLDAPHEEPAIQRGMDAPAPIPGCRFACEPERERAKPIHERVETVARFASESANGRTSAAKHRIVNHSPPGGRRCRRILKWRRRLSAWLERALHRLREAGAPLFRAPWLD